MLASYTARQKIIILIASIAFGFLAAWFFANRFCFSATRLDPEEKKTVPHEPIAEDEDEENKLEQEKDLQPHEEHLIHPSEASPEESQSIGQMDNTDGKNSHLFLTDLPQETVLPATTAAEECQGQQEDDVLAEMDKQEKGEENNLAADNPKEWILSFPPTRSNDEVVIDVLQVVPLDDVHQIQAPPTPKTIPPLTPREEMFRTFEIVWQQASACEKEWIKNLWTAVIKKAEVLKWQKAGGFNEYSLEIKNELSGTHKDLPVGRLIMKQKMKIVFREEKLKDSPKHRKTIAFPDKGLCYRVGWGYISKDTSLNRIIVEEHDEVVCGLEAFGKTVVEYPTYILDVLNAVRWSFIA